MHRTLRKLIKSAFNWTLCISFRINGKYIEINFNLSGAFTSYQKWIPKIIRIWLFMSTTREFIKIDSIRRKTRTKIVKMKKKKRNWKKRRNEIGKNTRTQKSISLKKSGKRILCKFKHVHYNCFVSFRSIANGGVSSSFSSHFE